MSPYDQALRLLKELRPQLSAELVPLVDQLAGTLAVVLQESLAASLRRCPTCSAELTFRTSRRCGASVKRYYAACAACGTKTKPLVVPAASVPTRKKRGNYHKKSSA